MTNHRNSKSKNTALKLAQNNGFTLVELLISIFIIGIVFAAITSLFITTSYTNKETKDKISALEIAKKELDSLKTENFIDLQAIADDQKDFAPTPQTVLTLRNGTKTIYISPIDSNGNGITWDDEDSDGKYADSDETQDEDEPILEVKIVISWKDSKNFDQSEQIVSFIHKDGL